LDILLLLIRIHGQVIWDFESHPSVTQEQVHSEEAIKLKPNELQAAKEIREAEEARWKEKHGKEPQFIPVKTPLAYNCTNTVPVLPPRYN
jgi:hypothetical protein